LPSAPKKSNDTVTIGGWGRRFKVGTVNRKTYTTDVIALHNSLNMSLHCGQCYGQIESIPYQKVSYCYFIKTETFSRIETGFPVF